MFHVEVQYTEPKHVIMEIVVKPVESSGDNLVVDCAVVYEGYYAYKQHVEPWSLSFHGYIWLSIQKEYIFYLLEQIISLVCLGQRLNYYPCYDALVENWHFLFQSH